MQCTLTFTVVGDVPDRVTPGDELKLEGVVTVHSVGAPLIDTSTADKIHYLPGQVSVGVYANEITVLGGLGTTVAAMREP